MKSEERHRLETNTMAQHLSVWIDQLRPYATTIAGIALFVFIAMFAWSYLSSSSASWQSQAWDQYNQAVGERLPNLNLLRQSAEEHPGTKMQEMADITWADGQVWMASRDFLYNRTGAMELLNRAASAYQSILQSSTDKRLQNRARMGLARIYEMQGEIDKAREQYGTVTGAYADLAKARAEALGKETTKETCAWLASAELPRPQMPTGPGTPGQSPAFSAGDVPLPSGTSPAGGTQSGAGEGASLDALLQGLNLDEDAAGSTERYPEGETPATTEDAAENAPPAADAEQPKE
jgi:predicted negative regulator of RcsB-dependent stress response